MAKNAKVVGWIVNIMEKPNELNLEPFCFSYAKTRDHYQRPDLWSRLNLAYYVNEKIDVD